jgi:hypothetical protein
MPTASPSSCSGCGYLRFQADALTDTNQRKMRMIDVYFLRL